MDIITCVNESGDAPTAYEEDFFDLVVEKTKSDQLEWKVDADGLKVDSAYFQGFQLTYNSDGLLVCFLQSNDRIFALKPCLRDRDLFATLIKENAQRAQQYKIEKEKQERLARQIQALKTLENYKEGKE